MIAIQVSQLVRFAFRDVDALVNVVPLTGAVGLCLLSIVAVRGSSLFHRAEKYRSTGLRDEDERRAAERVIRLLEDEKLWLEGGLRLADLARRAGLSRTQLSQVVNSRLGVNLSELLNRYRVEEARRLLLDPSLSHLTIEAIGGRSGFRSRSSFYEAYKRHYGESPSKTREHDGGGRAAAGARKPVAGTGLS